MNQQLTKSAAQRPATASSVGSRRGIIITFLVGVALTVGADFAAGWAHPGSSGYSNIPAQVAQHAK